MFIEFESEKFSIGLTYLGIHFVSFKLHTKLHVLRQRQEIIQTKCKIHKIAIKSKRKMSFKSNICFLFSFL